MHGKYRRLGIACAVTIALLTVGFLFSDHWRMQDDKNEETYSDTINHSDYVFEKEIATVAVTKVGVWLEPGGYAKYVTEDAAEIDVLKKCLLKLEENNAGAVRSENEPEREYKVEVFYADGTKEIRRYTLFLLSRYPNAMESFFALFPKRHIAPVTPISNLNFHVTGDVDEKKIDVRLEKYRDLSDCVIVGVHLSDGERQKTVRAFFEKYPELQQCRILGVGPEEEPVIEIPYSIVLELTKDPMISAVTWIENAQSEKVAVVGTIDGKNVYGASYASEDPFSVNDLPSDGSIDISQESLQAALRQMDDDEYIDVIVLPLASGKRMDEQLLYEESLRQGYEFGEEEMHEVKRDLFYEMVKEALEPIDYEGWVFLKDGTVDDYYPLYYREYAVRKEQLLNLELPANACFGYRFFVWSRENIEKL